MQAARHHQRGDALRQQGELQAAITAYRAALALTPRHAGTHNNLGVTLLELGALSEAIACFRRALRFQPDHAGAHSNLAHALLLSGDYANGWQEYEWRSRKTPPTAPHATPACPRWRGEPLGAEEHLLLVGERGLGDCLQFMRYLLPLRSRSGPTRLCAPAKLHGLIQASGLDPAPITPARAAQVNHGRWLPLLSLPLHLGVSPEQPLIQQPYLATSRQLVAQWAARLAAERRPIIAVHWQGNPRFERPYPLGRSFPLAILEPLARATDGSLLSLQKGFGQAQLQHCPFRDRFVRCQLHIDAQPDFLVTAAIMANCDLIITSDSAVAHLAGGLGLPTWLLLQHVPDWRWGLEGDTSFWYPTLRLFRQSSAGDWDGVIARVVAALQQRHAAAPVIRAPISLGELLDKITILEIKADRFSGTALEHVQQELQELRQVLAGLDLELDPARLAELKRVNLELWQIEEDIRDHERRRCFDAAFIRLARSVYQWNDQRAAIKKAINLAHGSRLIEQKSYGAEPASGAGLP